jgi:hypothetical protein
MRWCCTQGVRTCTCRMDVPRQAGARPTRRVLCVSDAGALQRGTTVHTQQPPTDHVQTMSAVDRAAATADASSSATTSHVSPGCAWCTASASAAARRTSRFTIVTRERPGRTKSMAARRRGSKGGWAQLQCQVCTMGCPRASVCGGCRNDNGMAWTNIGWDEWRGRGKEASLANSAAHTMHVLLGRGYPDGRMGLPEVWSGWSGGTQTRCTTMCPGNA